MSDDDIEMEFDSELPPLLPPGLYTVAFRHAQKRWLWGKRVKLFMTFEIASPAEHLGIKLFMCCNIPDKKKWTIGYKFSASGLLQRAGDLNAAIDYRRLCFGENISLGAFAQSRDHPKILNVLKARDTASSTNYSQLRQGGT